MALSNQPYLPLYVDDWMNNTRLKMCSPAAHGMMVTIMCLMHKEQEYGKMLLRQKFLQNEDTVQNFALQIARLSAFDSKEVIGPLTELVAEGVLKIEGDVLFSERMVNDNGLSQKRAVAGKNGGKATNNKIKNATSAKPKEKEFATANTSANTTPNAVNGIGIENGVETENETVPEKVGSGGKTAALLPWPSAAFAEAWQQWKAYRRKEHSFRYRSAESEQAALMELSALATTGEAQAVAIIRQSMGKGWKGFFELKQHDATPTKAGSRVQYSDDFRRKIAERLQPR